MTTIKNCPYCDELISINAIKCKHCGSMLNEMPNPSQITDPFTYTKMSLSNRYDILSEIGRGGMATVYKAIQRNLQRTVALKVIHQNLVHDKEFIERFHSEARLAASLNHPNIVSIYDEGIENGVHYIAMEYLNGDDLHKKIKTRGKLSIDRTIQIISPIAESLDYIHKRGLIHRDIKTSNIIITNDYRPVLTDFGIARAISGSKLSQTGSVLGTPEYMSPEQADGIGAEPRSDLYSLGIVLYECLTGTVPFTGDNPVATIYKIINAPPPPLSAYNGSMPEWIQTIVEKSLAKHPQNRFLTGKEFSKSLQERKKVSVRDNQTDSPRTQKLDSKELHLILNKKNKSWRKTAGNKVPVNQMSSKKRKGFAANYLIGGTILVLLLIIGYILLKDLIFGNRNIIELMKDANWATLTQSQQNEVLSLIQSGDELYEKKQLLEPFGNNAYQKYKSALKIHPTNNYALVQLEKIFGDIYSFANELLNEGNNDKVNSLISQLKEYYPEKESSISALLQNTQSMELLNESDRLLAKTNVSLEELIKIYENITTVLTTEPENQKAKESMLQLESKFIDVGNTYLGSNQLQLASNILQQGKNYFPNNSKINNRLSDARRKIESENTVPVPNVVGLSESEARNNLSSSGLKCEVFGVSGSGTRGMVVGQNVSAGTRVRRNSPIIINVIQ